MKRDARKNQRGSFLIVEFTNPSGATAWRVTGRKMNGIRVRENFKTHAEAVSRRSELEIEAANLESEARPVVTRLSSEQAVIAEAAFREIQGFPLSLIDAIRWAKANYSDPQKKILVEDAFKLFLDAKRAKNLRKATLRSLNQRVGRIAETWPKRLVSDIQTEELRQMIFRPGPSIVNQESDYRAFANFFNWAVKQGYCQHNPVAKIGKIKLDRGEPEILPLDAVRKLLSAAGEYKDGALVPYVALGLFCALRPTELEQLTWNNIDLQERTVTLAADIAKMRRRRIVEMPANCAKWLKPHALRRTPIYPKNWRKGFDKIKKAAGFGTPTEESPDLKPWPKDVMRHTGISCHLAEHENEGKTAAWAGNSANVVHEHYKALVKKADAKAFWSIAPLGEKRGGKKVLKMGASPDFACKDEQSPDRTLLKLARI